MRFDRGKGPEFAIIFFSISICVRSCWREEKKSEISFVVKLVNIFFQNSIVENFKDVQLIFSCDVGIGLQVDLFAYFDV